MSYECHNLQTAIKEPAVVDAILEKEVVKGFMIGPFVASPLSPYRVNPISVATRKYSGKKCLIIDPSAPHEGVVPSVNSLIPRELFSLYYTSMDNAISMITTAGRGAWLRKANITDAFKVMPLHPSQWHLFCVRWGAKLYFSVRLAFGWRSAATAAGIFLTCCWRRYVGFL